VSLVVLTYVCAQPQVMRQVFSGLMERSREDIDQALVSLQDAVRTVQVPLSLPLPLSSCLVADPSQAGQFQLVRQLLAAPDNREHVLQWLAIALETNRSRGQMRVRACLLRVCPVFFPDSSGAESRRRVRRWVLGQPVCGAVAAVQALPGPGHRQGTLLLSVSSPSFLC
jgi:hypothetical protein